MDYESALEFVYSRRKFEKSGGFERISALLSCIGEPQKRLRFVHVAGTNGKGSVSEMIACAAERAGLKTGLFTSPFVTDFRERIRINGEYIGKEAFASCISRLAGVCEEIEKDGLCPTFFEVVLAAALLYFCDEGCNLAVLEAGIGGENDSTNVIPVPEIAVITSVSLDHTEVLGGTYEEIARSKCGIIKSGCTAVSFPAENAGYDFVPQRRSVFEIIAQRSREKGCELLSPDMSLLELHSESGGVTDFSYGGLRVRLRLCGQHQLANAATAITALRALRLHGFEISDGDIESGLSRAFLPARMETVGEKPTIILDGGHNAGCTEALYKMLQRHYPQERKTALLGFMKDKDYESSIKRLAPLFESIVFTLADGHRGESPERLAECAEGLCKNVYCCLKPLSALSTALSLTESDGLLVCAGSFYLVSEIRKSLSAD